MKDKFKGLMLAILWLALFVAAMVFGYNKGFRQGQLSVMTDACRSHNAYWRIKNGEASFTWRYVPKWRDTCVVQEEK
jgi:hypothetical protein